MKIEIFYRASFRHRDGEGIIEFTSMELVKNSTKDIEKLKTLLEKNDFKEVKVFEISYPIVSFT